ncbi:PadR family transcriptional regulator [Streptomyces sp. NBC_01023]|nr:PadR family transcriptional regulator [Streptomyces sp. NBC_01023]
MSAKERSTRWGPSRENVLISAVRTATAGALRSVVGRPPLAARRAGCPSHRLAGAASGAGVASDADIGFVTAGGGARVPGFQRGAVRLHILRHAAEKEIHGAWMTEELARHGYQISPGTLYPTLHRLETDGLLVSEQRVVDGRTRRVCKVTKARKQALTEDRRALKELAREVLGDDAP